MKAPDRTDGQGSPAELIDHYRLLQVDPDAPYEFVAEAYWFLASRLRAEQAVRRSAERELAAINAAYQVLAVAEQRRAYDATVPRVVEMRRERALRAEQQARRPLSRRLLRRPQSRPQVDYYELLCLDPRAELPLVARAYTILKTLHSKNSTREESKEHLNELAQARSVLLDTARRAAYDESRVAPAPKLEAAPAPKVVTAVEPERAERPKKPSGPGRRARVGPAVSKALTLAAKGSVRLAAAGARLGYRGTSLAAKDGAKAIVATLRAGKRAAIGLQPPKRTKGTAPPRPDDRLLRDAPLSRVRSRKAVVDAPCRGRLVFLDGQETAFDLGEQPITLGSERECDVRLDTETGSLAPAHAQIWFNGERFLIRSLDPLYPTLVCGQRVNWAGLDNGDEIEIGPHRLRFEVVEQWDTPPEFMTIDREAAAGVEEIPERHD